MTFNFSSDLACYSLSKNNNVPTSILDMNHYYSYRQQQNSNQNINNNNNNKGIDTTINNNNNNKIDNKHQFQQYYNNNNNNTKKPSKLDVLIQTATSVDLDSFLPSNNNIVNTHNNSINSNKRKSSNFNLEYLCNQAEKELNSTLNNSNSNNLKISNKNLNVRLNLNLKKQKKLNSNKKLSNSQSNKNSNSNSDTNSNNDLNNTSNPLAIKLASPSNNTKRQRSGPSCDCCRSRKIKCDSEIFILSALDSINLNENIKPTSINSHIAHCDFISFNPKSGYQYYKIIKDEEHALNNKLTSFNYLQFKPCSACITKKLKCCFSKGFTRNDIIKFNKTEKLNNNNINNNNSTDSSVLPSPSTSIPASPLISNKSNLINNSVKLENSLNNSLKNQNLLTPSPTPAGLVSSNSSCLENSDTIDNIKSNIKNDVKNVKDDVKDVKDVKTEKDLKEKPVKSKSKPKDLKDNSKEKKTSKKTSCKTCRFKKIKCVKIDGSDRCSYCNKKSICCIFE